jgi:sporulation protein YlmC with PRC-barrel domain
MYDEHAQRVTATTTFAGHDVIDEDGNKLGTVNDVVPDAGTLEPKWLVVDIGVLKTSRYVPVLGAYRSSTGDIVVPYNRQMVKRSPKAPRDHVPTSDSDRELRDYYGLAS